MGRQKSFFELMRPSSRADVQGQHEIGDELRRAIVAGRLAPGLRLPSTRELASDWGVARGTVVAAYEQLAAEGYVVTRRGSGSHVTDRLPDSFFAASAKAGHSPVGRADATSARTSQRGAAMLRSPFPIAPAQSASTPFVAHAPDLTAFPVDVWARIAARRARSFTAASIGEGDARGYLPLRNAIRAYLGSTRGVQCTADQIIVLASVQQGLDLCARLLTDAGDVAWFEDPGYPGARAALQAAGVHCAPIPVDDEGIDVAWAARRHPQARFAYVTPGHQAPLGVALSPTRRTALLDWAQRAGAWIFEDDYDSEYRYKKHPLPALQALDRHGRVIYAGCFSKTLFPALRIAYIVVPPELADAFAAARSITSRYAPILDQAILCEFIDEGHYARHLRRMRMLYAERRLALAEAIESDLGGALSIVGNETGLDAAAMLNDEFTEADIAAAAGRCGLIVQPLSKYSIEARRPGVLLGFASHAPATIRRAIAGLAMALQRG